MKRPRLLSLCNPATDTLQQLHQLLRDSLQLLAAQVTFAAGLACEGLVPFCTIYSTFLQRGFDQVVHDVALQDLPGAPTQQAI